MQIKENNRREIEQKLNDMGDYVKIDYLNRCLERNIDFDTKRFALLKLAELYEKRKMHLDAGKMMQNAAPINPNQKGKISDFSLALEYFIKAGDNDRVDSVFKRALIYCNDQESWELKQKRINFYRKQAEEYLKKDKRNNALITYEILLKLNLTELEKSEVQKEILKLYEKLGKIKEFINLKKNIENKK